jgi:hypothetical protein
VGQSDPFGARCQPLNRPRFPGPPAVAGATAALAAAVAATVAAVAATVAAAVAATVAAVAVAATVAVARGPAATRAGPRARCLGSASGRANVGDRRQGDGAQATRPGNSAYWIQALETEW